ncbi:TolB-like translocation protein [Couchioplanes azureus]|uniref:hypothetical protein n=1 Tax=Couchioplanes caeruleus TaxID=56438 RepID=UPI00166FB12E|nr:hypothetical protein [Couchioplanes caeruleus]GGQ82355.1 hypothetical protein GCM10010166_60620 [Couchioplanes caeruleus subsp. azureus]
MTARTRWLAAIAGTLLLLIVAAVHAVRSRPATGPSAQAVARWRPGGDLLVRDAATGRVASVRDGIRDAGGPACDRTYQSARTMICLRAVAGPAGPRTSMTLYDDKGQRLKEIRLPGVPSRARVSPSGRVVAWTRFTLGDTYASGKFSTRTSFYAIETGYLVTTMETIALYREGRRFTAPDLNYWGITFVDDNFFYATAGSGGRTWLIRGDTDQWRADAVAPDVECPSLSPDETRIAYKLKIGGRWYPAVLDLATGKVTRLADTEPFDDQIEWLDDDNVAYGREGGVWSVPADGTGGPRLIAAGASSPSRWKADPVAAR